MHRWEHGHEISRPFRKLWPANRPTGRIDRHMGKFHFPAISNSGRWVPNIYYLEVNSSTHFVMSKKIIITNIYLVGSPVVHGSVKYCRLYIKMLLKKWSGREAFKILLRTLYFEWSLSMTWLYQSQTEEAVIISLRHFRHLHKCSAEYNIQGVP